MINRLVRLFIQDCDNVTDPAVREKYGSPVRAVGIVLNLSCCRRASSFAGVVTDSIATRCLHNLSDAGYLVGGDSGGLWGWRDRRPTMDTPFGHGRADWRAGEPDDPPGGAGAGDPPSGRLHPEAVDFSLVSVAILAASILVKLWMGHFNRALGKKLGSAAMAATAADSSPTWWRPPPSWRATWPGHFAHLSIDGWAGAGVAASPLKAG